MVGVFLNIYIYYCIIMQMHKKITTIMILDIFNVFKFANFENLAKGIYVMYLNHFTIYSKGYPRKRYMGGGGRQNN